jgi:hypothetical protein
MIGSNLLAMSWLSPPLVGKTQCHQFLQEALPTDSIPEGLTENADSKPFQSSQRFLTCHLDSVIHPLQVASELSAHHKIINVALYYTYPELFTIVTIFKSVSAFMMLCDAAMYPIRRLAEIVLENVPTWMTRSS